MVLENFDLDDKGEDFKGVVLGIGVTGFEGFVVIVTVVYSIFCVVSGASSSFFKISCLVELISLVFSLCNLVVSSLVGGLISSFRKLNLVICFLVGYFL